MKLNRGAVGVVVVSLALSGAATAYVLTPPAAPDAVHRASAADQAFVQGFYAAKERLVHPFGPTVALTPAQRHHGYAVGDGYVTAFRDSYADDPDLEVRSVDLEATLEDTAVSGDRTTFTVELSTFFVLHDTAAGTSFTGGELTEHVLTVRRFGAGYTVLTDIARPSTR